MESCAILEAQRMSPAADVWARGRKARAPATGVDGTGAAGPRSLTLYVRERPCRSDLLGSLSSMIQISVRPNGLLPDTTLGRRRTRLCSRWGPPGALRARVGPGFGLRLRTSPVPERTEAQSLRGRKPSPLEDGPRPSGTFQNGRWDGHPLPAGGPADSHGGAARNVMGE